jgi:hypothetical protein
MSLLGLAGRVAQTAIGGVTGGLAGAVNGATHDLTPGFSVGNVIKTQAGNVLRSSPAPTTAQPATQPHAASGSTQSSLQDGVDVSPYAGAGGSGQELTPQQQAYYNALYDSQIGQLQGQLGQLGQQRDVNNLQLQNQYQNSLNALQTQHGQGVRNLDFSQHQLEDSRARNLNDIAKQVEQMGMSYNNQLGSLGAGNSSASMMLNRALAGQASKNRGDVVRNASQQQQGLDMQRSDLESEFGNQMNQLQSWKQNQVNDLLNKYNDEFMKLQQAIAGAQGERAQMLSQYQPQLIQQAIDALGNLQTTFNQTHQNLVDQYNKAASASFNINPALQQFEVQPIDAGQVSQVPGAAPIANEAFDPVAAMLRRRDYQGNPISLIGG